VESIGLQYTICGFYRKKSRLDSEVLSLTNGWKPSWTLSLNRITDFIYIDEVAFKFGTLHQ
jgi:hypothetical protein